MPASRSLSLLLLLAACGGEPRLGASGPVTYQEVQRQPGRAKGAPVLWIGSMLKMTITSSSGDTPTEVVYLAEGNLGDSSAGPFVVLKSTNTPAADSLDHVSGDPGRRQISGKIRRFRPETLYVDREQRIMQAPVLEEATIDAPPAAAPTP